MKKVEFHEFSPVIYPFKIWVAITSSEEIVRSRFCEKDGSEVVVNLKDFMATTMYVHAKDSSKKGVLLAFKKRRFMDMNTVSHEASHAAKLIFEEIGAAVAPHEPFEYLLGWIAECCEKVIKGKE